MKSRLNHFEFLLVASLNAKPNCGYTLLHQPEHRSFFKSTLKHSSLYYALHRLEAAGLIVGKRKASDAAPTRVVYSVTTYGKRVLKQQLTERIAEEHQDLQKLRRMYSEHRGLLEQLEDLFKQYPLVRNPYRGQF